MELTYQQLQNLYSENFSLGNINGNIQDKFVLISLICKLTHIFSRKKPNVTCYQIIKKIISKEIQETFIANFQKDNIIPNKNLNNISNHEVNGSNCSFLNVNNENTNLIQPVNQISKTKKIIEWIKKRKYFIISLSIIGILLIFCLIFTI